MSTLPELCELVARKVAPSRGGAEATDIGPETPLLESGLLDSISVVQIVADIREQFAVEFPPGGMVAANFRTPRRLWEYVESLPAAGRTPA